MSGKKMTQLDYLTRCTDNLARVHEDLTLYTENFGADGLVRCALDMLRGLRETLAASVVVLLTDRATEFRVTTEQLDVPPVPTEIANNLTAGLANARFTMQRETAFEEEE